MEDSSLHFRTFATGLENLLEQKYSDPKYTERGINIVQKEQVEGLAALEDKFRKAIIQSEKGQEVYKKFVDYICDERKNILAARPFFRERQQTFTKSISTALKKRSWRRLLRFHVNYQFVVFACGAVSWPKNSEVLKLAEAIKNARNELVEMNLPLAISRSKIFWRGTPKSHVSFMDFIQIAVEGLIAAVDKYVLPYRSVFRSVAIGRMVGNFIEHYSATHLHFYPSDRRKIYRANKFLSRHPHGGIDFDDLADYVNNNGAASRQNTDSAEIANLVAAASTVSTDTRAPSENEEVTDNLSRYEAPSETRPDIQVEQEEALKAVYEASKKLSLFDRKFLRLKGVDIPLDF